MGAAIIKIYLKDIVSKAHFNSARFFSITKKERILESVIVGHFTFLAPLDRGQFSNPTYW